METVYRDRHDAGKRLAKRLSAYAHRPDVLILALPRGGVPVAYEAAQALNAPLDVFIVRKLGVPDHEELAMGAIASGGIQVLNYDVICALDIPEEIIEKIVAREQKELERREQLYRDGRPAPDVKGQTVILIDDGLATGARSPFSERPNTSSGTWTFPFHSARSRWSREFRVAANRPSSTTSFIELSRGMCMDRTMSPARMRRCRDST